ncbi:unnamed protein product, partial [Meganyctiphanes norvegica]
MSSPTNITSENMAYCFFEETSSGTGNDTTENGTDSGSAIVCLEETNSILRHSLPVTVLYCIAYVTVFMMGVVGNSFVVAVVVRTHQMRTVTNVFIANLAVADLLVNVLCLPFTLIGHTLI